MVELNESLMQGKPLSIQKLERLNREHPEDPRVLELLAYANLALTEKNHRLALFILKKPLGREILRLNEMRSI